MRKHLVGAAILLALTSVSTPTQAVTLGFECITNNSLANCQAGEGQLSIEATIAGVNKLAFQFLNDVGSAMSITDIYVDDNDYFSGYVLTQSAGADFSDGASPGELPGANTAVPPFDTVFSADSNPPTAPNGINTTLEWVTLTFTLNPGVSFQDVGLGLFNSDLRFGIHVQAFAGGGSDSFINLPPLGPDPFSDDPGSDPVPEPSTLIMLGAGLLGVYRKFGAVA